MPSVGAVMHTIIQAKKKDYIRDELVPHLSEIDPAIAETVSDIFLGDRYKRLKSEGFFKRIQYALIYDSCKEFKQLPKSQKKIVIDTVSSDLEKIPQGSYFNALMGDDRDVKYGAVNHLLMSLELGKFCQQYDLKKLRKIRNGS